MFKVQPVRSREYQAALAQMLGGKFHEGTFAFYAGEVEPETDEITSVIALCQFTFLPEKSTIMSLDIAHGSEEDEAVTILVRTVMNSVYRADIPYIAVADGAFEADFARQLGFREKNGELLIDLKKFYISPCHYEV